MRIYIRVTTNYQRSYAPLRESKCMLTYAEEPIGAPRWGSVSDTSPAQAAEHDSVPLAEFLTR